MSQSLNRAWQVATFVSILAATEAGSFVPVNAAYPEIIDLVDRKYVKKNTKLHNKDGNVAFVAMKGATAVDLLTDLGYTAADRDELSQIISQELIEAMTTAQTQAQPQVAAAAAPRAPQIPAAPIAPAAQAETPVTASTPAAPTVGGAVAPIATAAPVLPRTDGAAQSQPALDLGMSDEIDFGVAFTTVASKPSSKTLNYDGLVKAKLADLTSQPSLHVAGRKAKDLSAPVKRQAEYYEKTNGITFRVRSVGDTDPKGAGVRIFALTLEEAPERRAFGGKKAAQ